MALRSSRGRPSNVGGILLSCEVEKVGFLYSFTVFRNV